MWVKTTTGEDNIFIATKEGKAIQFSESDVRPMGRAAA
jgi:DNA gyrase subunit A